MADPHFAHTGIIGMMARVDTTGKLFTNIEDHDNQLLDTINKVVDRNDHLVIAGDFAYGKPSKYRAKINCKHIHFVMGNHDRVKASENAFGTVRDTMTVKITDGAERRDKVVVTHYPNFYWDGSHRGYYHVYGHVHGQREDYMDMVEPERRSMDVGVDNIYRLFGYFGPISESQIYEVLGDRKGHDQLDHYREYQKQLYRSRNL